MADARRCDVCSSRYQPQRATSRYCSATCRKRAQRAGVSTPRDETIPIEATRELPATGTVYEAVHAELTAAGKENSALGRICLTMATRVDHSDGETASSLASVGRELRATMDVVLKAAPAAGGLDELLERKRKKMGLSAG